MLIGYVSDERYVALPDVLLEFSRDGESVEARSRASGSVHAELAQGDYYNHLQGHLTMRRPGRGNFYLTLAVEEDQGSGFTSLVKALAEHRRSKILPNRRPGSFYPFRAVKGVLARYTLRPTIQAVAMSCDQKDAPAGGALRDGAVTNFVAKASNKRQPGLRNGRHAAVN